MPLIDSLQKFLDYKGLYFKQPFLDAFVLSAKTRPLIILGGPSGTGKSALPRAVGQYCGTSDATQPIAVNPDWHDNADMMGYFDLNGNFQPGEFIKIVRAAASDPGRIYVALIDEMNLAPVEEYFAQFLSIVESRHFDQQTNRVVYSDPCFNQAFRDRLESANGGAFKDYKDLHLTDNLLVVGTVNVDESTTPFSKKVLDRANVFLLDPPDLDSGLNITPLAQPPARSPLAVSDFVGLPTDLLELRRLWPQLSPLLTISILEEWINELKGFLPPLARLGAPFGLRVRDEIVIYLTHAAQSELAGNLESGWWLKYFDQQIMQRLLPKLVVEQGVADNSLLELLSKCLGKTVSDMQSALAEDLDDSGVRFHESAVHLQRLMRRLITDEAPVVGFW